eukprot:TRINITY_DN4101_c0_g2_i1.p1 TRINITY_DN4101_c0_g2~~TRINITY_DN4101_c0_g2_i1.p1  ORF type:complete len:1202 (+),score=240.17 TRINITY_DN4101_c0_g2_i1:508-4113(+)
MTAKAKKAAAAAAKKLAEAAEEKQAEHSSADDEDAMDVDFSDADSKISAQSSSSRFSMTIVGAKHAISAPPPFVPSVDSIFDQFNYSQQNVTTPRFEDEELDAPPPTKRQKLAETASVGPLVSVLPVSEAPLKVGPFSLFSLIRGTLLEAQTLGLTAETLKQIAAAQPRLHRTIPTKLNMANVILLSLNFLAKDPIFNKFWVSCTPAPPGLPYDESLWKWAANPPVFRGKQFGGSISDENELFILETMFWYCISRGLYSIDEPNRVFVVDHSAANPPVVAQAYSEAQRAQFRNQEKKRFSKSKKPYEYSVSDFPVVSVSRFEKQGPSSQNGEKSALLNNDAPTDIPMRVIVVDALARIPGGVGTVEDVAERLLDSHHIKQDSDKNSLRDAVSSVLTQLQGLVDSPVKLCSELNLWVYRYRERLVDDLKLEKSPAAPEKLVPHLFSSTSITRNVYWNPAGARRSNFSFLPPRRKIEEQRAQELIFMLIRNWNRTPEEIHASALRRRSPGSMPPSPVKTNDQGKKKKKSKRDQDPIPKHLRYFGEKRGSVSPTKRPGQTDREFLKEQQRIAKERQRQMNFEKADAMDVSELPQLPSLMLSTGSESKPTTAADENMDVDPVSLNTDAPAVVEGAQSAATQAAVAVAVAPEQTPVNTLPPPPARTTKDAIYFEGQHSNRVVVRSSATDPCFLPDTTRVALEIEEMRQEWPLAAFGSAANVDQLLSRCEYVLSGFSSAVSESRALHERSSSRRSTRTTEAPQTKWWTDVKSSTSPARFPEEDKLPASFDHELSSARAPLELFDIESYPDLEWFHQDNPLTSTTASEVSTLRLVDLPSCVGYLHWLANLDEAVEEYLSYRDWRPEPGTGGRNLRPSTDPQYIKDALIYVDPKRAHERLASSTLPCNSFESHHVRRRWNLFNSPPSFSKIISPLPALPAVEFARQRLPNGLWIPAELDFIYTVPPADENEDDVAPAKKRKRDPVGLVEVKSEASSSTSKKKTPKKLMLSASSSSSEDVDSGEESDFDGKTKKQKKTPKVAGAKKRKRSQDSDSETNNPYVQNWANPTKPTTKSRRGQALIEGPESAPDSCCRVVLARFSGKPLWPACIQTRSALKLKGFHVGYGGGEYLWPFSCGSHFENTHVFAMYDCIGSSRFPAPKLLDSHEQLPFPACSQIITWIMPSSKIYWRESYQTSRCFERKTGTRLVLS